MVNPLKEPNSNPHSYELLTIKTQPGFQEYKIFSFIFLSQGLMNIENVEELK